MEDEDKEMDTPLFPHEVANIEYINGNVYVRCPKIPSFDRWLMERGGRKEWGTWILRTPVEDVYRAVDVHVGDMPCTSVTIVFPEERTFPDNEITVGGRSVVWVEDDSGEVANHVYTQSEGLCTHNGKLTASAGAKVIVHYVPLEMEQEWINQFKADYPDAVVISHRLTK